MPQKKAVQILFILVFFIAALSTSNSSAQVRRHVGPRHRSFYISAGYNIAKYGTSTLHIAQPELNNKYDLVKVKADSKTGNSLKNIGSLLPWQLNYRLGYYFNYAQTCGFEVNYDPVNYHITDGQNVQLKGELNNTPNVNKQVTFSSKNGYYYAMSGANLLLLNFVRRFTVWRPNSSKIAVDAIAKLGAGPVMPATKTTFPNNSFVDPQFQLRGWNVGAEAAVRATFYRHAYVELACKYDKAMYSGIQIYDGTAKQNISTFEGIASIGFTLPSNRFNPLFFHAHRIITIIPFFQDKKEHDSVAKKHLIEKEEEEDKDQDDDNKMKDIPEFENIRDRKSKQDNKVEKAMEDSLSTKAAGDTSLNNIFGDTSAAKQAPDTNAPPEGETKKERRKREKEERQKLEEQGAQPGDTTANNGNAAPEEPKTKKELKAEQKQKEREAEELKDKKQQELEDKRAQEQQARDDKKAADEKAREELKAQKEKEREDAKAQREKEAEDRKAKREQELKDQKEKREKEKEEREQAREKAKEEREKTKEDKDKGN